MPGFLSQRSREMDPHLEMRRDNWDLVELWQDLWCSSRVEKVISGKYLSCLKGVDPFHAKWEGVFFS